MDDVSPRSSLQVVDAAIGKLPYMTLAQAEWLEGLLRTHRLTRCLELGFYHGKSSAFIAAILRDMGGGHLTTIDRVSARELKPNIDAVLRQTGLTPLVTVYYEPRSYTWRLMKMLAQVPRPVFDFVYIDGGHSWDVSGYAFFLTSKMLRPGGWMLFDDLDWTFSKMIKPNEAMPGWLRKMPAEEREAPQLRLVWELLVKDDAQFDSFSVGRSWALARKK